MEDDPGISELMRAVLEQNGLSVEVCESEQELKKLMKKRLPGLIIMDLWLPGGVNGEKLTRELKLRKATRHVPIIIVSAQNALGKIASRSKADGFLPKPFDIKEFFEVVQKYLPPS